MEAVLKVLGWSSFYLLGLYLGHKWGIGNSEKGCNGCRSRARQIERLEDVVCHLRNQLAYLRLRLKELHDYI